VIVLPVICRILKGVSVMANLELSLDVTLAEPLALFAFLALLLHVRFHISVHQACNSSDVTLIEAVGDAVPKDNGCSTFPREVRDAGQVGVFRAWAGLASRDEHVVSQVVLLQRRGQVLYVI